MIPADPDFWRPIPCGHPQDPVAADVPDGWACHCGRLLNGAEEISDGKEAGAPGPIVFCLSCGCHVAIPMDGS